MPKAEISDFILSHDGFVFTSLRDTSGNVVLEAMAVGLPVIAFRHHGVAEMTTDQTALRVPITQFVVAGIGIVIFIAGFLCGMTR